MGHPGVIHKQPEESGFDCVGSLRASSLCSPASREKGPSDLFFDSAASEFLFSLAPPSGQFTSFTCFPDKQSTGLFVSVRSHSAMVARSEQKF